FPEIQKQLDASRVDYAKVFLQGLDRDGIIEVVKGLDSSARLRKYRVTVDAALPGIVADDLLRDRDSPIAPTLQILMSRMWQRANDEALSAPAFTAALYRSLEHDGFLLGDFLDQQVAAIAEAATAPGAKIAADAVSSGLALDVLAYHTTPRSTAE